MRLLLAENEQALSKALKAILERNHYSVDVVYDGQTALEYLEADNYDGMILDIMMPKVDGITVLKNIRAKGNLLPVLLLTAKSEVKDKVLGLDAGANDYLTKPFHAKELLMANPKTLIATERFMEKIWGYDSNAEINVVWVYISYLRKKLTALQANIQIKAKRNAGYSLEEIT